MSIQSGALIGEIGAGKSTFINYVANYFLGGSLNSLKVVIPNRIYRSTTKVGFETHSEANLDDVTVSQTTKCLPYFFRKGQVVFRFIDTPGLSDPSNSYTQQIDKESIDKILTATSLIGQLHAIILIINGSASRLTVNVRNSLQRILGNYPDVFLNNMVVIFTNCDSTTKNFDETSLPFLPKKTFVMNNSAFYSHPSTWNEDDQDLQELNWKQSMRKIGEIVEFADQLGPQFMGVFQKMLEIRNAIKNHILRASAEIQKQQTLIDVLTKLKSKMSATESKLTQQTTKVLLYNSMLQSLQCQEQLYAATHSDVESHHYSSNAIYEYRAKELETRQKKDEILIKKTLAEIAACKARHRKADLQTQLNSKDAEMLEAERLLKEAESTVKAKYVELKRICRGFNFAEELKCTKESLCPALSFLTSVKVRESADAFIRSLDRLMDELTERLH